MSFLKNILGTFIEFSDKVNQDVQETKDGKVKTTNTILQAVTNPADTSTGTFSSGDLQADAIAGYRKHFEEVIEEANASNPLFKGTDFKEFIDSKSDVEAIADEPTRYRTAFNVLKRTGLTKERLLATGKQYISVIDSDLKAFESVYAQQYKTNVEDKEKLLQQKAQDLQLLNEKMNNLQGEIKELSGQVMQGKEGLTGRKNAFLQAGENKKKEIRTELGKIEQYF